MTPHEQDVLKRALGASNRYLEFGAGCSTKLAVACGNISQIVSVESDQKFFSEVVAADPEVQLAESTGRLRVHRVDIGETVKWGRPKNGQQRHLWPNYSLAPYNDFKDYDLVLVDGRFRMACALNAILNATRAFTLLVHDYRKRYALHRLVWSGLATVAETADSLVALRPQPVADRRAAQRAIAKYQYLPDDLCDWESGRVTLRVSSAWHYFTRRI